MSSAPGPRRLAVTDPPASRRGSPRAQPGSSAPAMPFCLTGALPTGRLALEASAGTGKTYALAGLVTRYVAEAGLGIEQLLLVTFTRAAAAELRERVRTRLLDAVAELSRPSGALPEDPVLRVLCDADPDERRRRRLRLDTAVADFDTATITTIHSFAQQVLGTLGAAAPGDADAVLVDDTEALVGSVCADLLVTAATADPGGVDRLPDIDTLAGLVAAVMGNPGIRIVPGFDESGLAPSVLRRRQLVDQAVAGVHRRRRRAGTVSFDDLLTELRRTLGASPAAVDTLRRRYPVVLVDEFQDTDPVQWDIFDTVLGQGRPGSALVLVADPKQAIYAFRGANVHTYLAAAHQPGIGRATLTVNWRSDGAMVDALHRIFDGVTFGDPRIGYVPVAAAPEHRDRRLVSTDHPQRALPAVRIRAAVGPDIPRTARGQVATAAAAAAAADDLAEQIRCLLDTGRLPARGPAQPSRPVGPGDFAVLVRTHREGPPIEQALRRRGVPVTIVRSGSVLETDAAMHWRWLLDAIGHPADPARARTAALSCFVGWTLADLAVADDIRIGRLQQQLVRWGEVLGDRGPAELCSVMWSDSGVSARVLSTGGGERLLTDLQHIGSLFASAPATRRRTAVGLLAFLDDLAARHPADPEDDLTARRVETEAGAVQIMTVYAAKGLEFPVVCIPGMWRHGLRHARQNVYQDPEAHERTIDVVPDEKWPTPRAADRRKQLALADAAGESLRLLYVALTRAEHQVMVWWAPTQDSAKSALARVLFARSEGVIDQAAFLAEKVRLPGIDDTVAVLESTFGPRSTNADHADHADRSDVDCPEAVDVTGIIDVAEVGGPREHPIVWSAPAGDRQPPVLRLAGPVRVPDRSYRRWSFTAIADRRRADPSGPDDDSLGDARAADEGDDEGDDLAALSLFDHPSVSGVSGLSGSPSPDDLDDSTTTSSSPGAPSGGAIAAALSTSGRSTPRSVSEAASWSSAELPLGAVPGGARFGTLVHEVLECVDFTAAELDQELASAVADRLRFVRWPIEPSTLVDGLRAAIHTPLGPLFDGRALRQVARGDTVREMRFELHLGSPALLPTDRQIGALVLRHLLPGDPLRPWAERLADGLFDVALAGHLTGSIDAVVRHRSDPDGPPRFVVVDYKTSTLSPRGGPPGVGDYHPGRLAAVMAEHHYPLQALLYTVALHRYLRWRLPGYQPAVHLGGVAYLFVRGMSGAATPAIDGHPHGVFSWAVAPELVVELSDLLAGSETAQ